MRTYRRLVGRLFAALLVVALGCSPVALATSRHHPRRHHHPVHRRRHHRHKPVQPKPKPKPTMPIAPPIPTTPTTTTPTTTTPTTSPSPNPPAQVNRADLGIVSITPSLTHAKVGDVVTFTIVATNYGPDPGEIDVNTAAASKGFVTTSTNCGAVNGPPPQPGSFGADGAACEDIGSFPFGTTVTDTVVVQVAPTSSGVTSDTACTWSVPGINDPNPSNDCATATVTVDSGSCPVGMPGATQTVDGHTYSLNGEDTFTKDAPLGSFASSDVSQVVYTGDHGMGWTEYPDGWRSTNSKGQKGYAPATVQSVHDGMLDFYLHSANGYPVGADPSPMPGGDRYQTHGAWSFCELLAPTDNYPLYDFHQATLLWPEDTPANPAPTSVWQSAESDFPEADLNATTTIDSLNQWSAYAHYGGNGSQDAFRVAQAVPAFDPTQWHVYTQTWGPGYRAYYVDGQLVGESLNQVYSGRERWQLQIEPSVAGEAGGGSLPEGHVYVRWVWIGAPSS